MHILYESNKKTIVGILKPSVCKVQKKHMGSWFLDMEHEVTGVGSYIKNGMYIEAPTPKGQQLFKISLKQSVNENTIKITAFHIMYDLSTNYVKDTNIVNKNRVEACRQILANTIRKHDFKAEGHVGLDKLNNLRIVGYDPFNAIVGSADNTVVNRYSNTEWDFNNTTLIIEDVIGNDNGYLFTYNKNMDELNEEENYTGLITQIVPVTTYNDKRILLPEVTVDSELINFYNDIITREIDFTLEFEEEENVTEEKIFNQLRQKARDYFKTTECDVIKVSYDLKSKDIINDPKYREIKEFYKDLNTGDFVYVLKKNGLRLKLRVREYIYDTLNETFENLVINNSFKSISTNLSSTTNKIDNVLNSNGSVNGASIQGILNALNVKFKAMRDVAEKQHVRAMLFEDLDPNSPTYGAMCIGSMGFEIASERDSNGEWIWTTFGSGQGFAANCIVTGVLTAILIKSVDGGCTINLETGEVNFNKGIIKGKNSSWNLDTGKFISKGIRGDGTVRGVEIDSGGLTSDTVLDILANNGSMNITCKKRSEGSSIWIGVDEGSGGVANDIVCTPKNVFVNKKFHCSYDVDVIGSLKVTGNKNCIQETKEFGKVPFYSVEDINSLLTKTPVDKVYETKLYNTGKYKCIIPITQMIRECINTDLEYNVWLTKYGAGDLWVSNTYPGYFVVESDRLIKFKYKLEGARKGFENSNEAKIYKKFGMEVIN